jgi:imidazole glycerol-phosphate synthase subunit HisH
MIAIIDYGMGNLRSVLKKFERMGFYAVITSEKEIIMRAEKLVLPGVGHFANGMKNLNELGLIDILNKKVMVEKIPVLGICLGLQLFARHSEEGNRNGLGWIDAEVIKFDVSNSIKYKIPHMGWNSLEYIKDSIYFKEVNIDSLFYFVHSYHINCFDTDDVLTTTNYEYSFVSSVEKENIFGTQFHPEKSHDAGELILRNFALYHVPAKNNSSIAP